MSAFSRFLSTPSSQRATKGRSILCGDGRISIHALFAEGDQPAISQYMRMCAFLSTPSSQRATLYPNVCKLAFCISIHALFAEGDTFRRAQKYFPSISIHALFAEGDQRLHLSLRQPPYFYPRPLRRGRRQTTHQNSVCSTFLSTPSSQRATITSFMEPVTGTISIHALFAEGDRCGAGVPAGKRDFYPRPLRRGRPAVLVLPLNNVNFYPRPLRRGRRTAAACKAQRARFLSTPSSQRATIYGRGL